SINAFHSSARASVCHVFDRFRPAAYQTTFHRVPLGPARVSMLATGSGSLSPVGRAEQASGADEAAQRLHRSPVVLIAPVLCDKRRAERVLGGCHVVGRHGTGSGPHGTTDERLPGSGRVAIVVDGLPRLYVDAVREAALGFGAGVLDGPWCGAAGPCVLAGGCHSPKSRSEVRRV